MSTPQLIACFLAVIAASAIGGFIGRRLERRSEKRRRVVLANIEQMGGLRK